MIPLTVWRVILFTITTICVEIFLKVFGTEVLGFTMLSSILYRMCMLDSSMMFSLYLACSSTCFWSTVAGSDAYQGSHVSLQWHTYGAFEVLPGGICAKLLDDAKHWETETSANFGKSSFVRPVHHASPNIFSSNHVSVNGGSPKYLQVFWKPSCFT